MRSSRVPRRIAALTSAVAVLSASGLLAATPASAHEVDRRSQQAQEQVMTHPIGKAGITAASAVLANAALPLATEGHPHVATFDTRLTRNPDANNAAAFTTPADTCAAPECSEIRLNVPAGSAGQSLYARASWPSQTQYVHIWGVTPDGKSYVGTANTASSVDKRTGNADIAPLAEFSVLNPQPGTWRIQVRAVFGYAIPVHVGVALVKGDAPHLPNFDVNQLADRYLTQHITFNVVFVNRRWTSDEIKAFRALMPLEYRNAVLLKQSSDGTSTETGLESTAENWGGSHYTGTDGTHNGGFIPYFEPLHYTFDYRFMQAGSRWTRDLFSVMHNATVQDSPFTVVNTTVGSTAPEEQGNYLASYDARDGKVYRGVDSTVANPTVGDKIDAFKVEDWIFKHRGDQIYSRAFTDVETGARRSGRFINPDPGAYFDPFYTRTGHKVLDRAPQGPATSFTYFVMDTFTHGQGSTAIVDPTTYFRPSAYHFFDVSAHMIDPDTHLADGPDDARQWGGRYRFFFLDLGAGPNNFETTDGFTGRQGGSADAPNNDPPIWDYTNNPTWQGRLVANTARDVKTMLFSRLAAGYLYRPIPADVYFLADNNWEDCYSNPSCSPDGVAHTDLSKIYHADYIAKNLGAAIPGATFRTEASVPGLKTFRYLGCAANRAVANPDPSVLQIASGSAPLVPPRVVLVPDPNCVGKVSDPIQEALEIAKSRGDAVVGGVNDATASAIVMRAWVEAHRPLVAPQPAGQFTLTNISVVWPGATTWDLPAIVGGIALNTPNGEGWGILNNTNDRVKGSDSTDCNAPQVLLHPVPGCGGVPPTRAHGYGFSYTVEHESSHFLGLTHPHDYFTVEKDATGRWNYFGEQSAHLADFSMAPTTYAGAFAPYSVLDQDIIQRGHIAEYLRLTQDYLADAALQDGMAGLHQPGPLTQRKVREAGNWRAQASALFGCGDYVHAEHAMRNATLAAQGVFGPIVAPRLLKPGEKVLFSVKGQPVFGPDGQPMRGCVSGSSTVPAGLIPIDLSGRPTGAGLPSVPVTPLLPALVVLVLLTVGYQVGWRGRGPAIAA